ncbi:hypothetical protein NQ315_007550 [Exocentrus adspersus]|uniref:Uncharacterized protein n=1 Tax=Exocentrus adspersus TaxID=1586481 RepID=A0AAV8W8Z2_9CUCU|nr:hypothetical protein NQ315_007550 [Exocentrus adspersus]
MFREKIFVYPKLYKVKNITPRIKSFSRSLSSPYLLPQDGDAVLNITRSVSSPDHILVLKATRGGQFIKGEATQDRTKLSRQKFVT